MVQQPPGCRGCGRLHTPRTPERLRDKPQLCFSGWEYSSLRTAAAKAVWTSGRVDAKSMTRALCSGRDKGGRAAAARLRGWGVWGLRDSSNVGRYLAPSSDTWAFRGSKYSAMQTDWRRVRGSK
ncbi:hypothetical protein K439DRAFT_1615037 [Ramaria rubella]|nr:hypothetical protein K439DRAFT_1615037 [Ramaria rubella]